MNNPIENDAFALVQSICREYKTHLKRHHTSALRDFLRRVDESTQPMLFQSLIHLDIEYRRRRGESPKSNDYLSQFPEHASLIRQAFFESTQTQDSDLASPACDTESFSTADSFQRAIGDYRLIRELGRGGFGIVYEAVHQQRGDRVALKTLPDLAGGDASVSRYAERLQRFRSEFRSLAEVNHPNLAGMQTLEFDGQQWFLTMDLVRGVDFLQHVAPLRRLEIERLRAVLPQLVNGVVALHRRGIVHRDLKPSNVMVENDGHLVILDFGLVAELQDLAGATMSLGTQNFAGTPRYAAPEQASGDRTSAIDWYALGTMLYEALTGKVPFEGSGIELLIAKQSRDAPSIRESGEVPSDLERIVDLLLQRDPQCRPTDDQMSAWFADAGSTYQSQGETLGSSPLSDSQGDSRCGIESSLSEDEQLVGRETQLLSLQTVYDRFSKSENPEVVFVRGRSGEGKTSLVEKFLNSVRRQDNCLILAGRCYDRESVPFKAIDCLIESLVRYLRSLTLRELEKTIPADIDVLAQLFPVLRRVEEISDRASLTANSIDSRQLRYRAFASLRQLWKNISKTRRVAIFVDDLQWGDADSAVALLEILNHPDAPRVLLLGSYRSDEASGSPFLITWKERGQKLDVAECTLDVEPLNREQCQILLASRLGVDPDTLRDQSDKLFADTNGNPYFLEQLIEGFDRETGKFQPLTLEQTIQRKLSRLPQAAGPLLNSLAIAGQATALQEMALVGDVGIDAFTVITRMRSERLVRLIGSDEPQLVDTYHDKIRETVSANLASTDRQQLHQRYFDLIFEESEFDVSSLDTLFQEDYPPDKQPSISRLFDLAHHAHQANDGRAIYFQLLAGEKSIASYAAGEALSFFENAARILKQQSALSEVEIRRMKCRIHLGNGRANLILKQTDACIEQYSLALSCARSKQAQALAEVGIASGHRYLANVGTAVKHYDSALKLIGKPRPQSMIGNLIRLVSDTICVIASRSPLRILRRNTQADDQVQDNATWADKFESVVMRDLAMILFEKDMFALGSCTSHSAKLLLSNKGAAQRCLAFLQLGFAWNPIGMFWVGRHVWKRAALHELLEALKNAGQSLSPDLHGFLFNRAAGVHYWVGELRETEVCFNRAETFLQQTGQHYDTLFGPHMCRHLAFQIYPSEVELQYAEKTHDLASELGNKQQICWGTYDVAVSLARRGSLQAAKKWMEESLKMLRSERYHMTESIRGASCAFVCLQLSDYRRAQELANQSWQSACRNYMVSLEVVAFSLPVLIESLIGPDWGAPSKISSEQRRHLRKLRIWTWFVFRLLPPHQSHLLRVWGRYDWLRGNSKKAKKKLENAVADARQRGYLFPLARALLDLSVVDPVRQHELQSEAIALLKKAQSVIPHAEAWQLGNCYDAQVVAAKFDAG